MVWTINYCLPHLFLCIMILWINLINSSFISAFRENSRSVTSQSIFRLTSQRRSLRRKHITPWWCPSCSWLGHGAGYSLGILLLQECCSGNCTWLAMYTSLMINEWSKSTIYVLIDLCHVHNNKFVWYELCCLPFNCLYSIFILNELN